MPIHYACVATEMKLYLPYLQELLPELVILGLNTPWNGFITKYKLLRTYLQTLEKDAIICFIDAYDVLPTKHISQLEQNYLAFEMAQPAIKMIVGYERIDNIVHEYFSEQIFGTVVSDSISESISESLRLNSGQFIGRVKNILAIIENILDHTLVFQTDQIELTKYANAHPGQLYIDTPQQFFYVKSKPLQQITFISALSTAAFVHANGNGFLENFLRLEHGIDLSLKTKFSIWLVNFLVLIRKIIMYDIIYAKKCIKKIMFFLYINNGLLN